MSLCTATTSPAATHWAWTSKPRSSVHHGVTIEEIRQAAGVRANDLRFSARNGASFAPDVASASPRDRPARHQAP
jgi:hypothetical protein